MLPRRMSDTHTGQERIIDFLKHCKSIYGKDFDINQAGIIDNDNYGYHNAKIIERLVRDRSKTKYIEIIKFILDEYGDIV